MMKHQLTGQTGDDLDVNVDAPLAAINEIAKAKSIARWTTRARQALMAAGHIPA